MKKHYECYEWQPWFAWYPVEIVAHWYWLRWIECRNVGAVAPNGDLTDYWEYRVGK